MMASLHDIDTRENKNSGNFMDDDIVCMPVSASHDGPLPRRDLRPTDKRRTAAEQFNVEHQRGHHQKTEAVTSDRQFNTVDRHSKAVPEMTGQMKKKRSLAGVKALKFNEVTFTFNTTCKACQLMEVYNQIRNLNLHPRCEKHVKAPTNSKVRGVQSKALKKKKVNVRKSRVCNRSRPVLKSKTRNRVSPKSCRFCQWMCTHNSNHSGALSKTAVGGKHPSVSSYNSFLSADHEPMVE